MANAITRRPKSGQPPLLRVRVGLKTPTNRQEDLTSEFVFGTCRAGSEADMKAQAMSRRQLPLKPSFMRPQLVTFKSPQPQGGDFVLPSLFARVSGISLGMFATEKELAARVVELFADKKPHLHVFPRVTPENGVSDEEWACVDAIRNAIVTALKEADFALNTSRRPSEKDWVVDVIVGDEGEKLFLGAHRHGPRHHPLAGALSRVQLPPDVPSRAYLKLEQALMLAGLDGPKALPGKNALELGSAPGGATYALLKRGVNVIGVDTAEMDPRVLEVSGKKGCGTFTHLPMTVGQCLHERPPLPRPIHLIVADMNMAPQVMLHYIEKLQARLQARILILTLKINDPVVRRGLTRMIKLMENYLPSPIRAAQLPANRDEICVVAGQLVHRAM